MMTSAETSGITTQQTIGWFKERYQIDPTVGSQWMETDDIEHAVSIACITGRAYLGDYVITWAEGAGYNVEKG